MIFEYVSDRPVYVIGISPLSGIISESLSKRTEKIYFMESPSLPIDHTNANTMVMIDGLWLKNASQREAALAIRSVILNGSPVVVIAGPNSVLIDAIGSLGISFGQFSGVCGVYGIRYYPSIGVSDTIGIGGSVEDIESLGGPIALAYDWANRVDTLPARCAG